MSYIGGKDPTYCVRVSRPSSLFLLLTSVSIIGTLTPSVYPSDVVESGWEYVIHPLWTLGPSHLPTL